MLAMSDDSGTSVSRTSSRRGPLILLGAVAAAIAVLGVLALTGVIGGGHDVDEAAWRDSVEQQIGHPVEDWPTYRDVWLRECDEDTDAFQVFVATGLDAGTDADMIRSNVRYACPNRLQDVEDVLANGREMDAVCAKSPAERTDDEAMLAEAMGC